MWDGESQAIFGGQPPFIVKKNGRTRLLSCLCRQDNNESKQVQPSIVYLRPAILFENGGTSE